MMTPEAVADVFVTLLLLSSGISLIWIIYSTIKERRHPGSTWLYSNQASAPLFSSREHKTYTTIDGLSGSKAHFDENGNYVGSSMPVGSDGSMIHFDADGNLVGRSDPGLFSGDMIHTDANGDYAGQSTPGLFGDTIHSGKNGGIGVTDKGSSGVKMTDFWDN